MNTIDNNYSMVDELAASSPVVMRTDSLRIEGPGHLRCNPELSPHFGETPTSAGGSTSGLAENFLKGQLEIGSAPVTDTGPQRP